MNKIPDPKEDANNQYEEDAAKKRLANSVLTAQRFFECEVTIRLMGITVLHFFFPPRKK